MAYLVYVAVGVVVGLVVGFRGAELSFVVVVNLVSSLVGGVVMAPVFAALCVEMYREVKMRKQGWRTSQGQEQQQREHGREIERSAAAAGVALGRVTRTLSSARMRSLKASVPCRGWIVMSAIARSNPWRWVTRMSFSRSTSVALLTWRYCLARGTGACASARRTRRCPRKSARRSCCP